MQAGGRSIRLLRDLLPNNPGRQHGFVLKLLLLQPHGLQRLNLLRIRRQREAQTQQQQLLGLPGQWRGSDASRALRPGLLHCLVSTAPAAAQRVKISRLNLRIALVRAVSFQPRSTLTPRVRRKPHSDARSPGAEVSAHSMPTQATSCRANRRLQASAQMLWPRREIVYSRASIRKGMQS